MTKRITLRYALFALFIITLATTACAPRAGTGEIAAGKITAGEIEDAVRADELLIDLPAIVLDFDNEGNASIAGLPIDTIAPGALDQLNITPEQIQQLTALNIQHIQINNRENGLMLLVNGLSMPSARWDEASLMNTLTTLDALGLNQAPSIVADLLPLIQQVGVAVVARFPLQDGAQAIPLYNDDPNSAAIMGQQARDQFLASVGRAPVISIPVTYTEDGTWSVNGVTENEYMALIPSVPWTSLHLSRAAIQALQSVDIAQINIATNQDGIHVRLNGNTLPHIGWSNGELQNLITLVDQTDLLAQNGITITPEQIQLLSQTLLPIIQASDVNIRVQFPE